MGEVDLPAVDQMPRPAGPSWDRDGRPPRGGPYRCGRLRPGGLVQFGTGLPARQRGTGLPVRLADPGQEVVLVSEAAPHLCGSDDGGGPLRVLAVEPLPRDGPVL